MENIANFSTILPETGSDRLQQENLNGKASFRTSTLITCPCLDHLAIYAQFNQDYAKLNGIKMLDLRHRAIIHQTYGSIWRMVQRINGTIMWERSFADYISNLRTLVAKMYA